MGRHLARVEHLARRGRHPHRLPPRQLEGDDALRRDVQLDLGRAHVPAEEVRRDRAPQSALEEVAVRLALLLLAFPALAFAQVPAEVKLAQASFHEYLELLAIPNDAINPPDIQKNTDWLEQAFRKHGFTT